MEWNGDAQAYRTYMAFSKLKIVLCDPESVSNLVAAQDLSPKQADSPSFLQFHSYLSSIFDVLWLIIF